jgi:hypothetical protein
VRTRSAQASIVSDADALADRGRQGAKTETELSQQKLGLSLGLSLGSAASEGFLTCLFGELLSRGHVNLLGDGAELENESMKRLGRNLADLESITQDGREGFGAVGGGDDAGQDVVPAFETGE